MFALRLAVLCLLALLAPSTASAAPPPKKANTKSKSDRPPGLSYWNVGGGAALVLFPSLDGIFSYTVSGGVLREHRPHLLTAGARVHFPTDEGSPVIEGDFTYGYTIWSKDNFEGRGVDRWESGGWVYTRSYWVKIRSRNVFLGGGAKAIVYTGSLPGEATPPPTLAPLFGFGVHEIMPDTDSRHFYFDLYGALDLVTGTPGLFHHANIGVSKWHFQLGYIIGGIFGVEFEMTFTMGAEF